MGKVKDTVQEVETFYKTLDVKLTDDEIMLRGQELARQETLKNKLEIELKVIKDNFKQDIGSCDLKIREMTRIIEDGSEPREIKCYYRFNDPEANKKTLYSYNDGVAIEVSNMTDDERQDMFKN